MTSRGFRKDQSDSVQPCQRPIGTVYTLDSKLYTQSPIIKNGAIRNNAEILGKFKERRLSSSKLRNA